MFKIIHIFFLTSLILFPTLAHANQYLIDGELSEWSTHQRIDAAPWQQSEGIQIHGQIEDDAVYMALSSNTPINPGTTIWLDTDMDATTGYLLWGWAIGAEYKIEFLSTGEMILYDVANEIGTADSDTFGIGIAVGNLLEFAQSSDLATLEIKIPLTYFSQIPKLINVMADINDQIYLPRDYTLPPYTISAQKISVTNGSTLRVALVFSQDSASHFFYDKAYSQLYMSLQHQTLMAGIPFDLIYLESLTDINQIASYDALIFPYASHINSQMLNEIKDTLYKAIYQLGIGVLTAGDFFTNDETGLSYPGDTYIHMKKVLGLKSAGGSIHDLSHAYVSSQNHSITKDIPTNDALSTYNNTWVNNYSHLDGQPFQILVQDTLNTQATPALLVGTNEYPIVHFNTPELLANSNLGWRAIQWLIFKDQTPIGLKITRQDSIFAARNDMDQSQYHDEFFDVYTPLMTLLRDWHEKYNFPDFGFGTP